VHRCLCVHAHIFTLDQTAGCLEGFSWLEGGHLKRLHNQVQGRWFKGKGGMPPWVLAIDESTQIRLFPHMPVCAGFVGHPLIRFFPGGAGNSVLESADSPLCAQPCTAEPCALAQTLKDWAIWAMQLSVYAIVLAAMVTSRCMLVVQLKRLPSWRYCVS